MAPDTKTIYDFETQIEAAVASALTTAGITSVSIGQAITELESPWITVQLQVGAATGHCQLVNTGAHDVEMPDVYTGRLTCALCTLRDPDTTYDQRTTHASWRGLVRATLLDYERKLTLTYLTIDFVQEDGTAPSVEAGDNLDVSTINFKLQFRIRPDAWPATI